MCPEGREPEKLGKIPNDYQTSVLTKVGDGSGLQVLDVSRAIVVGFLRDLSMFSMVPMSLQPSER